MFKFVVLCAFLAAAAAEPSLVTPITYTGGYVAPAAYPYYSNGLSSLYYSSPVLSSPPVTYTAPVAHLIKKRSASLVSTYVAPTPYTSTYVSPYSAAFPAYSPIATTYGAAFPSLYTSPLYTTGHLIKKRAASLFGYPSTYIAPTTYTATSPVVTPTYTHTPYLASPYYPTSIFGFPIKK